MYTKEQISLITHEFWTAFGQYMALELSSEGEKISWLNYKTGIKHLQFKMEASRNGAEIAIELSHPDGGIQLLLYEQFESYKPLLLQYLGEEWTWAPVTQQATTSRHASKIYKQLQDVNILRKTDWPDIISFFKPRIIALESFWNDTKEGFDLFR